MRPLPSDLLRSFAAVAQTGSFTVASERVCLSQSTVSQQIRRLEDLIGQPLFERDTRNVRLSPHGEILLRYAQKILDMMDEAVTELRGPPLNGTVRLALPEDFPSTRLTTALASFVRTGLCHRSSTVGHTCRTGAGVGAPRGGAGIVTPALLTYRLADGIGIRRRASFSAVLRLLIRYVKVLRITAITEAALVVCAVNEQRRTLDPW